MGRAAVALSIVLFLVGCGSKSGNQKASEQPPAPATSTSACQPPLGATPDARSGEGPTDAMLLTSVRIEALECTDRLTFGFRAAGGSPGYNISYEPAAAAKTQDGSGDPVAVAGSAFLVVRLVPAMTAEISGDKVTPTYTGPKRINEPGSKFVRELVKTGDFESIVTWAIGLDERRPYKVTASDGQLVLELG